MQNLRNRWHVKKCAQNAWSNVLKIMQGVTYNNIETIDSKSFVYHCACSTQRDGRDGLNIHKYVLFNEISSLIQRDLLWIYRLAPSLSKSLPIHPARIEWPVWCLAIYIGSLHIEFTRDLKGLRVESLCDKHRLFNYYNLILSKIRLMDKIKYMSVPDIPHVFFFLGTLTCMYI